MIRCLDKAFIINGIYFCSLAEEGSISSWRLDMVIWPSIHTVDNDHIFDLHLFKGTLFSPLHPYKCKP